MKAKILTICIFGFSLGVFYACNKSAPPTSTAASNINLDQILAKAQINGSYAAAITTFAHPGILCTKTDLYKNGI